MHIAIVLIRYKPYGGYERQAALLADTLLARGHKITIISSQWTGEKKPGLEFIQLPIIKLSSWLKTGSFALMSRAVINKKSFDLTIAFDRSLTMDIYRAGSACHKSWLAARIKANGLKARISIAINPLNRVINRIEKSLFANLKKTQGTVVVLSSASAKQIQNHYHLPSEQFKIIPPAVDFNRFKDQDSLEFRSKAREKLNLQKQDRLLLHVGSGFRIKGVERIIRALPHLQNIEDYKFRFIAIGADKKGIRQNQALAKKLAVDHMVEFPGGVENVGEYYAAADCFLLLSMLETFGAVTAEALWFGLPTLIGRGAGSAGLISNSTLGEVVEESVTPDKLAQMINVCLNRDYNNNSKQDINNIKQQRRNLSAKCDLTTVMDQYLELIETKKRV
ncbi:MAG: glycosyltransferase family 4 protein [Magnetococcales bacterium]|nr:glycosyltransferase family 4 protein [Magnetococcales bacterium]